MERTYKDAIAILNSRRRPDRPATNAAIPADDPTRMPSVKGEPDLRGRPSISGMREWLEQLGHSMDDINRLHIIHVAGTKGKGSTCAYAEALLRARGRRTGVPRRTGLYTSPHLQVPEERIRLDGAPIARALFTRYFFEVWDAVGRASVTAAAPRYLQLFALVSYHAFIREGVDAAVYETHHGGEYDATNVVTQPAATAIATLGLDHVAQLGPSLENIAWHKAGILKRGVAAVAAPQDPRAAAVLRERAAACGAPLAFVDPAVSSLPAPLAGIEPEVQRLNAALAWAAVDCFLAATASATDATTAKPPHLTDADGRAALASFHWPGRFQLVDRAPLFWFIDSAHNELSITPAAQWFAASTAARAANATAKRPPVRILVFSQDSDQRSGADVLRGFTAAASTAGLAFDYVCFTTYIPTARTTQDDYCIKEVPRVAGGAPAPPSEYESVWREVDARAQVRMYSYIEEAMGFVNGLVAEGGAEVHVLVTGSQHLVGGVLRLLEGIEE